jgi:hypothetical protein
MGSKNRPPRKLLDRTVHSTARDRPTTDRASGADEPRRVHGAHAAVATRADRHRRPSLQTHHAHLVCTGTCSLQKHGVTQNATYQYAPGTSHAQVPLNRRASQLMSTHAPCGKEAAQKRRVLGERMEQRREILWLQTTWPGISHRCSA